MNASGPMQSAGKGYAQAFVDQRPVYRPVYDNAVKKKKRKKKKYAGRK